MTQRVKVDIWSDIACPFCYIGKRKFEQGVTASGLEVEVEFHSFELSPETPLEFDGDHFEFLTAFKGIPEEQGRAGAEQITALAQTVGLRYDYDRLQHTKTELAHQLLHYAKQRGAQAAMKERLMAAYFGEGQHLGRVETLAVLAGEVGLDRADVVRSLTANEFQEAVLADQQQAGELGIRGVPFFVVNGTYGVSGAQSPESFADILTKAAAEEQQ